MRLPTIACAAAALAVIEVPAFPQFQFGTTGTCDGSGRATINVTPPRVTRMGSVTGAPYSARESHQSVQTLLDGTHITRSDPDTVTWRDSSGRVRTEIHASPTQRAPCRSVLQQIEDPVAGYLYVIDPVNQIAHRIPLVSTPRPPRPARRQAEARPARAASSGEATVTSESLGTQVMFGVEVAGTKRSTTYPAGSWMGNDRPLTITSESWTSSELGTVYSKNSNPDGTVSTVTLNDLSTAEPDPSLFEIPAAYKVVDETGPFTVSIAAASRPVTAAPQNSH